MPFVASALGPIVDAAMKIIDRIFPDPAAKASAQLELLKLQQAGEFKQIEAELAMSAAQTNINQTEAANPNIFVSGWRPAVGWVCVAALICAYIGQPLLSWVSSIYHFPIPPKMDLSDLMYLLLSMLGIGGMRTYEKIKGVA